MKFLAIVLAVITLAEAKPSTRRGLGGARPISEEDARKLSNNNNGVNYNQYNSMYGGNYGNDQYTTAWGVYTDFQSSGYYAENANYFDVEDRQSSGYSEAFASVYNVYQTANNGQNAEKQYSNKNVEYFFTLSSQDSIQFKECVSLRTFEENLFSEDLLPYTKSGQIVAQKSIVLFDACKTGKCDSRTSEHHTFMIELEDWIGSSIDMLFQRDEDYCYACQESQDFCEAYYPNLFQQQQYYENQNDGEDVDAADEGGEEGERRRLKRVAVDCKECMANNCFDMDNDGQADNYEEMSALEEAAEWVDDIIGCMQTDAYFQGYQLYAGFMCNGMGTGAEIAMFLDDACTMYVPSVSFQSYAKGNYQGYAQNENYQANNYQEQQGENADEAEGADEQQQQYNGVNEQYYNYDVNDGQQIDLSAAHDIVTYTFNNRMDCKSIEYVAANYDFSSEWRTYRYQNQQGGEQQNVNEMSYEEKQQYYEEQQAYYEEQQQYRQDNAAQRYYSEQPSEFCQRIFQDNARDVDQCTSRAKQYGYYVGQEEGEWSYGGFTYEYDLSEADAESSWRTCVAVSRLEGKYSNNRIYDHEASGTTFKYNKNFKDGSLFDRLTGDDAKRMGLIALLSVLGVALIYGVTLTAKNACSKTEDENEKAFALLDEPEMEKPSISVTPSYEAPPADSMA